jgi:peroxiredoxin
MAENKSNRWLLIAFAVAAIILVLWSATMRKRTASPPQPAFDAWVGRAAPDFALDDLNSQKQKLSEHLGKDVLIVFWATWCPPCRAEIPHLIELRNEISPGKLEILAISDEDVVTLKSFAADNKMNYTILSSYEKNLPSPYNMVRSIPMSFFVDPKGRITKINLGAMNLDEIKAALSLKEAK